MAKRPSITDVSSGYQSNDTLNENFQNLQEGFDNTLSRDGSTPNEMEADLDMNSNDILNAQDVTVQGDLTYKGALLDSLLNPPMTGEDGYVYTNSRSYSGDGSKTNYSLNFDPINSDNTLVYIDGIYQQKNTYSVAGTVLTFTEAPPVGVDNVEIVLHQSVESATGPKGDTGDSAYDIWLAEGNVGTEADFLASLEGTDGMDGSPGDPGEGVPTGGNTGQVLKKASAADFDTIWQDETGGGVGNYVEKTGDSMDGALQMEGASVQLYNSAGDDLVARLYQNEANRYAWLHAYKAAGGNGAAIRVYGDSGHIQFDGSDGVTTALLHSDAETVPDPKSIVRRKDGDDRYHLRDYATRDAFVADKDNANYDDGDVIVAGDMRYVKEDGNKDISDLNDWAPYGVAYPDHWAENTTPGTTDMKAAIEAGATAGYSLKFQRGTYLVSDTVTISTDGVTLEGVDKLGSGDRGTVIELDSASSGPALLFVSSDPTVDPSGTLNKCGVSNMAFLATTSASRTEAAVRLIRCNTFRMSNVRIDQFNSGLKISGGQLIFVDNFLFKATGQVGTVAGTAGITVEAFDKTEYAGTGYSSAFNIFIDQFEIAPGTGLGSEYGMDITYADGLYVTNGYFGRAGTSLLKLGPTVHENISALGFTNVYFDQTVTGAETDGGPYCVYTPNTASAGGISGAFTNCFFGQTYSATNADMCVNLENSDLQYFKFTNCDFANTSAIGYIKSAVGVQFTNCRGGATSVGGLTINGQGSTGGTGTSVAINGFHFKDVTGTPLLLEAYMPHLHYVGLSASGSTSATLVSNTSNTNNVLPTSHWIEDISWTPRITIGGSNVGITYGTQSGQATRIGNQVYFNGTCTLTSRGGLTGEVKVVLPQTADANFKAPISLRMSPIASGFVGTTYNCTTQASSVTTSIKKDVAGGTSSPVQESDITDTTEFNYSGVYSI